MSARLLFAIVLLLGLAAVAVNVGAALQQAYVDAVPETVSAGFAVWQAQGCEGCHTLYGQGGGYAPDLTRIAQLRGADY
ncbi:MAG: cytochrome c, partial [Anaerolineae bacterium]|nr:cytochrome c [Anaerolineae bacterium]